MTIGIVSRLDVPRNRRGGLERIGPNSGPVKKSAKAPTPLKTPVQIVDPEDRPWRTQYRRTSLRLVQLTSRRLVLRGRFRLPTDFSHSVFIPFGEPAGPWELPHGRGSVTLFPNRERFIFLPGTPRLRLSGWGAASPFGRLRERYAAPRSTFRPVPWLRNRGPSKSECWANCTNRRETVR